MKPMQKQYKIAPITLLGCILIMSSCTPKKKVESRAPNFIVFLTDDQGYNDVGCFGSPNIKTPNLDKMAQEGMKFTSFYAQPVCGPSRAALLSGSYPIRIGEPGNRKALHTQLHTKELTIAEILKTKDYKSACIGKWHAGQGEGQMPLDQGFDYYLGTPMYNGYTKFIEDVPFRCKVLENRDTIQTINTVKEMGQLTKMYTEKSVEFIKENKDKPFFLYLSHSMPHVPLGATEAFLGKSEGGFYGDVIEELDWSMGQILKVLKELNLEENTLVIFTSDNGPWIEEKIGDHGGSAFPLRGYKMQTWEGGIRVPGIMQWKGHIPEGIESSELLTTMDFLPTFAELAKAELPDSLVVDGKSFTDVVLNNKASKHEYFYYYAHSHLQAVRDKRWKLVLPRLEKPTDLQWWARKIDAVDELQLFDMLNDKEEQFNLADKHPEKVNELMLVIEQARLELGDKDVIGNGARFFEDKPKTARIKQYNKWQESLNKTNKEI